MDKALLTSQIPHTQIPTFLSTRESHRFSTARYLMMMMSSPSKMSRTLLIQKVRAAVHNYDEDVPANTIRAWVIGMSLVVVGASMNTLFSLRTPSIGLGALIAQIIAWPLGHGWAKVMPTRQYTTFGLKWSLNPGPFNIKEHSIIVVMASVSFSAAYATDILLAQIAFYKQDFGILFQLLLVISTQSVGYGIAGMMRKFLV
jgi:OPT family oligopeptide transporter